ncbi:hypothetical protein J3F83DRAFT_659484 [Trichoderma novae-zelandiae]
MRELRPGANVCVRLFFILCFCKVCLSSGTCRSVSAKAGQRLPFKTKRLVCHDVASSRREKIEYSLCTRRKRGSGRVREARQRRQKKGKRRQRALCKWAAKGGQTGREVDKTGRSPASWRRHGYAHKPGGAMHATSCCWHRDQQPPWSWSVSVPVPVAAPLSAAIACSPCMAPARGHVQRAPQASSRCCMASHRFMQYGVSLLKLPHHSSADAHTGKRERQRRGMRFRMCAYVRSIACLQARIIRPSTHSLIQFADRCRCRCRCRCRWHRCVWIHCLLPRTQT